MVREEFQNYSRNGFKNSKKQQSTREQQRNRATMELEEYTTVTQLNF